ncbi:MAG: carboxypeptidase regulatory-like domain-containing protein [Chloroflexi bacterium]|nr:carboxypeptidase regulatory-like domain-containing protein [Chloroflexota bacterium]
MMSTDPQTPDENRPSEIDIIRIGFLRVPKEQIFPIVLVFILLATGTGIVVATQNTTQLLGLVAIIVGLGWAALIFQNAQNRRKYDAGGMNNLYDITITVVSDEGQPMRGASVTIIGPVPFTDKKTDKDGRVEYSYTGLDANNYRNREVLFTAKYEGRTVNVKQLLHAQAGQFLTLTLPKGTDTGNPKLVESMPTRNPIHQAAVPSASAGMDALLYQQIVDVITHHTLSEASRVALINRAFFNEPVVNMINTSGTPAEFAAHLVTQLYATGGSNKIIVLLQTLRTGLGEDHQNDLDKLTRKLQE